MAASWRMRPAAASFRRCRSYRSIAREEARPHGGPGFIHGIRASPDGQRIATERGELEANAVNIFLVVTGTGALSRVTSSTTAVTYAMTPLWSADGRRVLFDDNSASYKAKTLDGDTTEEIHHSTHAGFLLDWSADGQHILFTQSQPGTGEDLWVLSLTGDRRPTPYQLVVQRTRRPILTGCSLRPTLR